MTFIYLEFVKNYHKYILETIMGLIGKYDKLKFIMRNIRT